MILIPSLHIRAGRVVVSPGGQFGETEAAGCAATLGDAGAKRVLVVNADAARGVDDPRSRRAMRNAVNSLRDLGITVDVGGGIRSQSAAEFWVQSGANAVVLGTIAVYRPDIAGEICRALPGQIIVGIDARGDLAHSDGWIRDAGAATIHLRRWSPWPAAAVMRTTTGSEPFHDDVEPLRKCIGAYPGPLIVNGGVRTLADAAQAAATGAAAVVIDVATPAGGVDVAQAIGIFPGRDLVAPPAGG